MGNSLKWLYTLTQMTLGHKNALFTGIIFYICLHTFKSNLHIYLQEIKQYHIIKEQHIGEATSINLADYIWYHGH